ncbi:hypothetical protein [Salinivibrio sharmensis]|uniref:Uncharacterized protein n=1 Tax=Salinivibrio sharmensis TaxID=390883 RepID=A0ABX3KCY6_9GAMM|nr:hypothetical protein [Salinivibrio sharmensis]OOE86791.1 hypothetical protein BZG74_11940 [Salinivibrio sharmensis]
MNQDDINALSYLDTIIASLALVVALIAALYARISANSTKFTAKLAEQTLYQSKLVAVQSYPSVDFVEIVDEKTDSPKLRFMIYNVYDRPIKLESVQVYIYDCKPRTLRNLYKHYTEGLDLDFRLAEGVHWNPLGDLEPKLYYKKDAAQFRIIKDQESILVSVREINNFKNQHLKVIIRTNISEQTLKFDTYGSNLLFEVNSNIQYHIKRLR